MRRDQQGESNRSLMRRDERLKNCSEGQLSVFKESSDRPKPQGSGIVVSEMRFTQALVISQLSQHQCTFARRSHYICTIQIRLTRLFHSPALSIFPFPFAPSPLSTPSPHLTSPHSRPRPPPRPPSLSAHPPTADPSNTPQTQSTARTDKSPSHTTAAASPDTRQ